MAARSRLAALNRKLQQEEVKSEEVNHGKNNSNINPNYSTNNESSSNSRNSKVTNRNNVLRGHYYIAPPRPPVPTTTTTTSSAASQRYQGRRQRQLSSSHRSHLPTPQQRGKAVPPSKSGPDGAVVPLPPLPLSSRAVATKHIDAEAPREGTKSARLLRIKATELSSVRVGTGIVPPPPAAETSELSPQQPIKTPSSVASFYVSVRKRALLLVEEQSVPGADCVEVASPTCVKVKVHGRRVDMTPVVETHSYELDAVYDTTATNSDVYKHSVADAVHTAVTTNSRVIVMAFGASGTGKSHTLFGTDYEPGLVRLAAADIFKHKADDATVLVSAYELGTTTVSDLMNDNNALQYREDPGTGLPQMIGLSQHVAPNTKHLSVAVAVACSQRERGHVVVEVAIQGTATRVVLIDVTAADSSTKGDGRSMLAMKECIRAVDAGLAHVPYRSSRLTEIVKGGFQGTTPVIVLATVSPCSPEVSLNTLRMATKLRHLRNPQRKRKKTKQQQQSSQNSRGRTVSPCSPEVSLNTLRMATKLRHLRNPQRRRKKTKQQ
eukprot:PhM_4_TR2098/c2_g1_i1/m.36876/K10393/KIF2_24, MCAK; kinesin family member 2/24